MIKRILEHKIRNLARKFPALAIMGPRQSGKTTLVRTTFPALSYISLENPDHRLYAQSDPRGFLEQYRDGAIFDEIQKVPELFSYLQQILDETPLKGHFILTGSQNFLLHEKISQTLAGRVAMLKLLPLSMEEIQSAHLSSFSVEAQMFRGFYPRIYAENLSPTDWYPSYIQSYVERDVRDMKNIGDITAFQKFLKLCAGQVGQLLNLSALGIELGISHNTIKSWISILEASFIIFLLQPHHKNFRKRLIKMPKLYFWDTGLVCSLLNLQNENQLSTHYSKGSLFENFVVSELMKNAYNQGKDPALFFWRDAAGHEVDIIMDEGGELTPIEIKSSATAHQDFTINLRYWNRLAKLSKPRGAVVYAGNKSQKRIVSATNFPFVSWKELELATR